MLRILRLSKVPKLFYIYICGILSNHFDPLSMGESVEVINPFLFYCLRNNQQELYGPWITMVILVVSDLIILHMKD